MSDLRVTLFDYGAGNLHSLGKGLEAPGVNVTIEEDPARSVNCDVLVLPGVGAFGAAADRLHRGRDVMKEAISDGLPCLGICLGMQLLFDESDEGGGEGLGIIPGRVERLVAERVPQIGWNRLEHADDPLLHVSRLDTAYYANGFVCRPANESTVRAWTTHESDRFPAMVREGSCVGVQFHPEKSSSQGVAFLRAFLDEARTTAAVRR